MTRTLLLWGVAMVAVGAGGLVVGSSKALTLVVEMAAAEVMVRAEAEVVTEAGTCTIGKMRSVWRTTD